MDQRTGRMEFTGHEYTDVPSGKGRIRVDPTTGNIIDSEGISDAMLKRIEPYVKINFGKFSRLGSR